MKKKLLFGLLSIALLAILVCPLVAAKPSTNSAGAVNVTWNLSGAVMPVPPYGTGDIPGSDTASKLIVNQPNGAVEATLTGVMKGLNPNTVYTVYLAKSYQPYVYTGWSITGDWVFLVQGGYTHKYSITQTGNTFTGIGGYPASADPSYAIYEKVSGTIDPLTGAVTMTGVYYSDSARTNPTGYSYTVDMTISASGSMSGAFVGNQAGLTIESTSGTAVNHTGNTYYPGLFTSTVPSFTFTTGGNGAGSWHLNLRDDNFAGSGPFMLSVWINGGGKTVLISDNFAVV